MLREILNITLKELLQLLRDKRMFPLILIAPVLQLLIYGYAATFDIENIATGVLDRNRSSESREYLRRFFNSRYFRAVLYAEDFEGIRAGLDSGKITAALVIPPDFARDVKKDAGAKVQMIIDGTNSNEATLAANYAANISQRYAMENLYVQARISGNPDFLKAAERAAAGDMLVDDRLRIWYNPSLRSRNFMVPGVIALILLIMTSIMTAMSMVREKEIGTMEQLIVTPVRSVNLILGKLIPYFAIGLIDVLLSIFVAVFLFGVPLRGSPLLIMVLSSIFLFGGLSLGILISVAARSQLVASQISMIATFLPAFLLSGFMFSISNMPGPLQALTVFIPARYLVTILKGIFLKGSGLKLLAVEALLLSGFGLFVFLMANRIFRKRIE